MSYRPTRKSDVYAAIKKAGRKGLTSIEIAAKFPACNQETVARRIRDLLTEEKVHRRGDVRAKALILRAGSHPEGRPVSRPSRRVVPARTATLLRDIQRAINRRDLTGPGAAKFAKQIEKHLS